VLKIIPFSSYSFILDIVYYHYLDIVTTIKNENLSEKIKVIPTSFRNYSQYVAFSKHMGKKSIKKNKKSSRKTKRKWRIG